MAFLRASRQLGPSTLGPSLWAGYFRSDVLRLADVDEDLSEPEDVLRLVVALRLVSEDAEAFSVPLSVSSPSPREPVMEEDEPPLMCSLPAPRLPVWPLLPIWPLLLDLSDI